MGADLTASSYQFCSPVKWTDTQELLLSNATRILEIGPNETLTAMIKQTHIPYHERDLANSITREFLSLKKNSDNIYYIARGEREEPELPRNEVAVSHPATASDAAPQQAAAPTLRPTASTPISDIPLKADDIVRTIVSTALKRPVEDVPFIQTIRFLAGGKW